MLRILLFLVAFALPAATALRAHSAPGSAVLLDLHSDRIDAELRLPLAELELAFGQPLAPAPATVVARFGPQLAAYLQQHLTLRSPDGRDWSVEILAQHVNLAEQPIDLVVTLALHPPVGAPLRRFTFHYDVITHEVMNHFAILSLRSDWNNARLGGDPEVIGAFRSFARDLEVDRAAGSGWRGFTSVFQLGVRHIAEGTDHLLFLLTLLLPAPLLVSGRRWGGFGGLRHSVIRLAKIVTAFTVGHSLTLAAGAIGPVRLPSQPVEILIAVSIFVSAVHAWRPIFAGREAFIAAGFGLVHGLAFATVLTEFQLDAWHLVAALFAFNLGIEFMQLLVVVLTIPWLVLLARSPLATVTRLTGALVAATAAIAWIAERTLDRPNPITTVVTRAAGQPFWLLVALAAVALAARASASSDSAPAEPA